MSNPIFNGLVKEEIEDVMYMREGVSCRSCVDNMLTESLYNMVKKKFATVNDYQRNDMILNETKRNNHLKMLEEFRR